MSKAWVLRDVGRIAYEEVDVPVPGENEVRIRVRSAGICGSDIPRIYKTGAHRMPLVPGHEFSGVVEDTGSKVSASWLSKRVAVIPRIACGKCPECREGMPNLCRDYDFIGSRRDGAFAEYVTVSVKNLLPLPDRVSFEEAAMLEPLSVAANAVRTGCFGMNRDLAFDRPVAVCGSGTIGLMVVMLLVEAGFRNIYLVGNKASQMERAGLLGIPEKNFCNSKSENVPEWLRDVSGGGISTFFECVGKNECVSYGIEAASPGGWMILVGNPYSDMAFAKDTYWKILRKQMAVFGIWNSLFNPNLLESVGVDDWNYVLEKLVEGRISPAKLISHSFGLEELEDGLHLMHDKTEDYCKVMINVK